MTGKPTDQRLGAGNETATHLARGALAGIRVVEWGEFVTAPYCAKLLADLGADVIKVEDAVGGDRARYLAPVATGVVEPERSYLFQYLNTGKRSIAIDFADSRQVETLRRLVASADVFVHNQPTARIDDLQLDFESLSRSNQSIVVSAVTPFGLTGPYRDWKACNMVLSHLAGLGVVTHWRDMDTTTVPPVRPAGYYADFVGGIAAAAATLAGLAARDVTGEPQLVDVSTWDAAVLSAFHNMLYPSYVGRAPNYRRQHRTARAPMGYMKCSDGYVWAAVLTPKHWTTFTTMLDLPALAEEALFETPLGRGEYWDVLEPILSSKIQGWTRDELFNRSQRAGIPIVPLYDTAEAIDSEQIRARGFLVSVNHSVTGPVTMPGNPCRLSETPATTRPAPLLGQHTHDLLSEAESFARTRRVVRPAPSAMGQHGTNPLSGIRVLDLSWVLAGPLCAQMLVHLGAEVIKVESEQFRDIARTNPPFAEGEQHLEKSAFYASLAVGKKTVMLDLSKPDGLDIAKELVKKCDVVIENFSPGTMERLGLGYDELRRIKPDIILVSISGVGQTGPMRSYRFYGLQVSAMSGLSAMTGFPNTAPVVTRASGSDPIAALYAAFATLAALRHRTATGVGQAIDISMLETTLAHIPDAVMEVAMNGHVPPPTGNAEEGSFPVDCFRCLGLDAWIAIAIHDEPEWIALCRVIGRPDLLLGERLVGADKRRGCADEVRQAISAWTSQRSATDAMHALQAAGVPAGASYDAVEIVSDPHFKERGFMQEVDHHVCGVRLLPGVPWKISGMERSIRRVPLMGEHNAYVLLDLLGIPPLKLDQLADSGVIPSRMGTSVPVDGKVKTSAR